MKPTVAIAFFCYVLLGAQQATDGASWKPSISAKSVVRIWCHAVADPQGDPAATLKVVHDAGWIWALPSSPAAGWTACAWCALPRWARCAIVPRPTGVAVRATVILKPTGQEK